MIFNVGQNIQIIPGNDIYDSVRLAGFKFAGSSDLACQYAVSARGVGQVTRIEPMLANLNPNDRWCYIAWQLSPIANLPGLPPQKFNQQVFGYSEIWLSKYFIIIP